ncbi:hypothetical protein [Paraburkholderia strydomiana]|uniref:hypothetical protein n=1 Tax=Paraburkholderia strydomiana TaxID=1245417 RepID=UPI0038BA2239
MKRMFLWAKKHWASISAAAALALSVFNIARDTIFAHNLTAIIRMSSSIGRSLAPGYGPHLLSLPEQILLINSGKSSEVILNSELVVGLQEIGKSELTCEYVIEHKDPIIVESQKAVSLRYENTLSTATELISDLYKSPDPDDDATKGLELRPPEVRYGISLTYLNSQNEIATTVIELGTLLVNKNTGEIGGTKVVHSDKPITVVGLEPLPVISRLARLLRLDVFVDVAKELPCNKDSFQ